MKNQISEGINTKQDLMWFDGIKLTKNQFKFDNMLFSTSKP